MLSKLSVDRASAQSHAPNRLPRVALSALVGCLAWGYAAFKLHWGGAYFYALDFSPHWRAADAMIRGFSPYAVINAFSPVYPFGTGYLYMLPAAVLLMPFGLLQPQVAMPLFTGVSVAVFTYAITLDGYWRLPLLASAPVFYAARAGQVVPLVTAAMLLPSLGWLAPVKFTIGFAGAVFNLSRRYIVLALAIIAITIVIWPWWPAQWWAERNDVIDRYYHVPLLIGAGPLLLAGVLRWRRPEARLLLAMSVLPQTMVFYDQLPLALVARSYRQALLMAIFSYLPRALIFVLHPGVEPASRAEGLAWYAPVVVGGYYLPCLAMVLMRPNVGTLPPWLERASALLPTWLRGCPDERGDGAIRASA